MQRHPSHSRPAGTGGGARPPSLQPAQPQLNPNLFLQNNALYQQNFASFPPQNPYLQNPNILIQDHNNLFQFPNFPAQQQGIAPNPNGNPNIPYLQSPISQIQNPNYPLHNRKGSLQHQKLARSRKESLEKIELAVVQVRRDLIAAEESVSTWKVSQSALVALQADSWESLGFQLQEVPSIYRLILVEGKINAFINCYVAVRRIVSLYDLELAICKNEGVGKFEELELGPLLRHSLVMHYFSVNCNVTTVHQITSEEVVSYLFEFVDTRKGKNVKVEEFLDFIAKKCKVADRENLGVRIQSLGMHITFIREAQTSEDSMLQKHLEKLKNNSGKKSKKRPLFSSEKRQLDERFSAITQRVMSFSSVHKDFSGTHIRFVSSSSDDDDADIDDDDNGEGEGNDSRHRAGQLSSLVMNGSDRVSSCPYPSAAEEMKRLGLRGDTGGSPSSSNGLKHNSGRQGERKRRKVENQNHICSSAEKLSSREKREVKFLLDQSNDEVMGQCYDETNLSLTMDSIRLFIATWKEACQVHTAAEVFEKMLQFNDSSCRQNRKLKSVLSTYPFLGLLNVAVASIKNGMWDSIYDTFQSIGELGQTNTISDKSVEHISIDVEPNQKDTGNSTKHGSERGLCVNIDDIFRKLKDYFALDKTTSSGGNALLEKMLLFARKLYSCEAWLAEQFSVKEFKSLGYGEYFGFLEKHGSLLAKELHEFVDGKVHERSSLEVSMLQQQLVMLLSQASNRLWENEGLTKQKISDLLIRQFPLISFKIVENGGTCMEDILNIVREHQSTIVSNCVLFSAALLGTDYCSNSIYRHEKDFLDGDEQRPNTDQKAGTGLFTSKDAVEVLLRAPMLYDLNSWLHWDLIYAPSVGPLLGWLLNNVNIRDLLCLLTKDGKIIRIDHLASVDSFFESLLQGSSFLVAVELLSLFALSGGKGHVPLSLLKCHARQAFEVILTNGIECPGRNNGHINDRTSSKLMGSDAHEAVSLASKLVLDCLGHLPSEFRSFAADILLHGLQSIVKDAPSAVLLQCKQNKDRLMLHEVGFSLGILEWIEDHHAFCPVTDIESLMPAGSSPFITSSSKVTETKCMLQPFVKSSREQVIISSEAHEQGEINNNDSSQVDGCEVSGRYEMHNMAEVISDKDADLLIESIRSEEFGLDPNLSDEESNMLKKQHARLGRALHCLSQELYSQDSHFLLELVQNADDNVYPEKVEPTLLFIIQETGIIVLNNERGFTAQNIRALCDVGNSTKKGSSAGYIGQKGIGFKSVFRVTDAPEIHSNGFHIKFDISEGQIGFVLPTVIPPCNMDLFRQLASASPDQMDSNSWNTCIVLPFRSKLSEVEAVSSIVSMFSDLHPSLLLFLHRLQCIKLRNMLNGSFTVMRKEIVGEGITKVTHGKEQLTWFVASRKLHPQVIRSNVQETEISIAFTLKESENGSYDPYLEQQPVFAFLPLRMYGLKFIIQGDFVLPSSREEVDGDSPWNQWLLSEFPSLFVSAEKSFCALTCYRENPGKAISSYMSFVPLIGEVHGFFSCLPRMIISKLRLSNCLLLEGCKDKWVPPCKVLRSWNEQAHVLLPDILLHEHLGLGFLDKEIILSDPLARVLGIEDYGPKILVQFISSLSSQENGLSLLGLSWLCSWLNELYNLFQSSGQASHNSGSEVDLINTLRRVPFVPLSDGTFGSLDEGTIWLNADSLHTDFDVAHGYGAFPSIYATLRIVSPALFSAATRDASCQNTSLINNITRMLRRIGVKQLSAHEIIKVHILPSVSDEKIASEDDSLMIEYLAFVMLHLQSSCVDCRVERDFMVSELHDRALILTNHGYKRPIEASIHFSQEFGNSIDVKKLIGGMHYQWLEVDSVYLKHRITESLPSGLTKWREFFQDLGIADFVKIVKVEKTIADLSPTILQQVMMDADLVSPQLIVQDWESPELVRILSLLSETGNLESSKYLLEVFDSFWDDCFCDKTVCCFTGKSGGSNISFKSSLMNSICDSKWVASTMDNELHHPTELFYDCDAVRSVVGTSAPYAFPKIGNRKLLTDIGFKTEVAADDILPILEVWRRSGTPFKARLSQMSKFYAFVWNALLISRTQVMEALHSGPFVYMPYIFGNRHEDVVAGTFLSPDKVYWHDFTGALCYMKELDSSSGERNFQLGKTLCYSYPGLHDFFVNECGVNETPPLRHYLQILQQLSNSALPVQAANAVFHVFLRWSDGLKSGALSSDDVIYLKASLQQLQFTVLPTVIDKWVSLHPSFGLVCWCDDDILKNEFKNSDNIEFLYFGELTSDEQEILQTKVYPLMKILGIPSLSEVVTREAIYYGLVDSSFKASLVAWALPFAQRYIYNVHPKKYEHLKLSGSALNLLRVLVVESLFYRNVIKRSHSASKRRYECSCLLQGSILYMTQGSDTHSMFMELSRLLFDDAPELHMANFLHMITTMVESGSTEEQVEFFILNSQKMLKLPEEESVWTLPSLLCPLENDKALLVSGAPTSVNKQNSLKAKKKPGISSWPPVGWKTAPGFSYANGSGFPIKTAITDGGNLDKDQSTSGHIVTLKAEIVPVEMSEDMIVEDDTVQEAVPTTKDSMTNIANALNYQPDPACNLGQSSSDTLLDPLNVIVESHFLEVGSSKSGEREKSPVTVDAQQAALIGRLGELVAFRYFCGKDGKALVKWVNEDDETGLPYDIVIGENERIREYIEVKATRYASKGWFVVSTREWQFAVDKGDSFSIAHVVLTSGNAARITIYKNPFKLCQFGKLQLAIMMPKQQRASSVVPPDC
ncbi:hypothetical protein Ancab_014043 [Ancistrocladus abbreviatus]